MAPSFDAAIEPLHGAGHFHINGVLGDPHTSFRDPFVFLLHSNVDRLFAQWQLQPGHLDRVDPAQVYGVLSNTQGTGDVATGARTGAFSARWSRGRARPPRTRRRESFRRTRRTPVTPRW